MQVRQKLTSSQLIHFLRLGERDPVIYRLDTTNGLSQQQNIFEVKLSEPIFPEKNSRCDFSASCWTIATSRELWDTVDFSNMNHPLPEPPSPKMMDFLCHDWKVPEVSSSSTCSSVDQSCALNGCRDPHTLMDASEDVSDVNVKIPEFHIRKFEEMPVIITHIVNPDKFFIQHEDTNLSEISEALS